MVKRKIKYAVFFFFSLMFFLLLIMGQCRYPFRKIYTEKDKELYGILFSYDLDNLDFGKPINSDRDAMINAIEYSDVIIQGTILNDGVQSKFGQACTTY